MAWSAFAYDKYTLIVPAMFSRRTIAPLGIDRPLKVTNSNLA